MSFELRTRLILLGAAYLAFIVVPAVISAFMGSQDSVWMHLTMSNIVKAVIGAVLAVKLIALRRPLSGFIQVKVAPMPAARGLTPADLAALCDQGCLLALFLVGAFVLMPLLEILIPQGGLLLLAKLGVLGLGLFLAYNGWKTFEGAMARGIEGGGGKQPPPH